MNNRVPVGSEDLVPFGITAGRIIILILALFLLLIRLSQPAEMAGGMTGQIISWVTIGYCLSVFVLSFSSSWVKENFYQMVYISFFLFAAGFLYSIYHTNFSSKVLSGFLAFSLISAYFTVSINHLLTFQLSLLSGLSILYFIMPASQDEALVYILRFSGMHFLAFFIISSRIQKMRKLLSLDNSYKNLIENLFCGVIRTNEEGIITRVNQQICSLTGYAKEELEGKASFEDLLLPEDIPLAQEQRKELIEGKASKFEVRMVRKNGGSFHVKISGGPGREFDGEISGTTMVLSDISREKSQQEKMDKHVQDLEMANEDLIHQKKKFRELAQRSSGEMREPLDRISQTAGIIQTLLPGPDPITSEYLEEIVRSARHLNDQLDHILLYAISGTQKPHMEPIDPMEVIHELERSMAISLKKNKAEIITKDLPVIMADRIQISRLIGNLIENAIENRGAEPPLIKIGCSKNEDRQEYVFSVSDNGRGLNREEYERIFHLFGKEDPDSAGGVDIALHVCHKIARNHGGRLWFTTSSGKGSTFFFSIPIPGKSGEDKPEFTNIYKQTRAEKEDL